MGTVRNPNSSPTRTDSRSHQDVRWNEFAKGVSVNPEHAQVTQPEPDLTYGFPVIQPSDEVYQTLSGDRNVDNFSLPVLQELRIEPNLQLMSTPTTGVARSALKRSRNALKAKHLMCFP